MSKHTVVRNSLILGIVLAPILGTEPVQAQGPMGSGAYQAPARAGLNSMAMKFTKERDERTASAASALSRAPGTTGSSNAVGNWQQIEMILGNNADGMITVHSPQDSVGNQTSDADATSSSLEIHNETYGLVADE